MVRVFCVWIAFIALLSSCSGGGGSGQQAVQPVAGGINSTNAIRAVAVSTSTADLLVMLGVAVLGDVFDLWDANDSHRFIYCYSGSGEALLADNDLSGAVSEGDAIELTYSDCLDSNVDKAVTGVVNVDVVSIAHISTDAASGTIHLNIPDPLELLGDGNLIESASGSFNVDFTLSRDSSTGARPEFVSISTSVGETFSRSIADSGNATTELASNVSVRRLIDSFGEYEISLSLAILSESVGSEISCATSTDLIGVLAVNPSSGNLICEGRGGSTALVSTLESSLLRLQVDAEGDGTYLELENPAGTDWDWFDFISHELVSRQIEGPTRWPRFEVPTVDSSSLNVDYNSIVYNGARDRLYATTDSGLVEVDPNALTIVRSVSISDQPQSLTISDDGSVIWIVLGNANEIATVDVASFAELARIQLGDSPYGATLSYSAWRVQAAPGANNTFVVAMRGSPDEVIAYRDGLRLPDFVGQLPLDSLTFLHSNGIVGTGSGFANYLTLGQNGLTLEKRLPVIPGNAAISLAVDRTRALTSSGIVFDPVQGIVFGEMGSLDANGRSYSKSLYVDSSSRRAYFYDDFDNQVVVHDLDSFLVLGVHRLPTEGNMLGIFEINSGDIVFAQDSVIHVVKKEKLVANQWRGACDSIILDGRLGLESLAVVKCHINEAIYDAARDKIYASLPSHAGPNGNSIAVINPTDGVIESYIPIGSEPDRLSLSARGDHLFVSLAMASRVAVVDLRSSTQLTPIDLEIGQVSSRNYYFPDAIAASPTEEMSVVVVTPNDIALYVAGERAPNLSGRNGPFEVFFSADGTEVYSPDNPTSVHYFSVAQDGLIYLRTDLEALPYFGVRQQNEYLFARGGQIYDTSMGALIGTCPTTRVSSVGPDMTSGLVYYLDDVRRELWKCVIADLEMQGQARIPSLGQFGSSNRIFRAGPDRIAVSTDSGLFLLDPAEL